MMQWVEVSFRIGFDDGTNVIDLARSEPDTLQLARDLAHAVAGDKINEGVTVYVDQLCMTEKLVGLPAPQRVLAVAKNGVYRTERIR